MIVCVYGTLRHGLWNHGLIEGSDFLDEGRLPGYQLHLAHSIPYAVEASDSSIFVEAYEVDVDTLAALDRLEGHPVHYRRTPTVFQDRQAWIYLDATGRAERFPVIEGGDYATEEFALVIE